MLSSCQIMRLPIRRPASMALQRWRIWQQWRSLPWQRWWLCRPSTSSTSRQKLPTTYTYVNDFGPLRTQLL